MSNLWKKICNYQKDYEFWNNNKYFFTEILAYICQFNIFISKSEQLLQRVTLSTIQLVSSNNDSMKNTRRNYGLCMAQKSPCVIRLLQGTVMAEFSVWKNVCRNLHFSTRRKRKRTFGRALKMINFCIVI